MNTLQNVNEWGACFGILPVQLTTKNDGQFLFQSGMRNDSCIRFGGQVEPEIGYASSWSVGAPNYIHATEDKLFVYNWEARSKREFEKSRVESDLYGFIKYLNRTSFRSEANVLDFVLNLFRKMRNLTPNEEDSSLAINLLCRLLISLQEEDSANVEDIWGIHTDYTPYAFDLFVEQMREGVMGLKPNLDLILRHCAGPIFETATQEVINYYPQRDLFGGISSKIKLNRIPYASLHYTPLYLARGIVENVLKNIDLNKYKDGLTIIDPACGSGVFLLEILKQLRISGYSNNIYLKAYDKSNVAIQTTKFLLEYEKRSLWGVRLHLDIQCVDSLTMDWGENDIVVMNPPYLSWMLMDSKQERPIVQELLKHIVGNKPNMASAFVYKAVDSLAPHGVVGAVLPASILTADSYRDMREWLKNTHTITHIASLGSFVFESAITDASFVILRNTQPALGSSETPLTIWCKNEKDITPKAMCALHKMQTNHSPFIVTSSYSIYHPNKFPVFPNSWHVISAFDERFINDLNRYVELGRLTPLRNVLNIFQGVVTGLKDVFEISYSQYLNLPKGEQKYFRPLVDHDSFHENAIHVSKYLWYPYDENGSTIKTEEQAMACSFVREHLFQYKEQLQKRQKIYNWWELTWPRKSLMKRNVRMYSARFGTNKLFGVDMSGEAVTVEGNGYNVKSSKHTNDLYFYLAICSSETFKFLLSLFSKRIMSGYDLSPKQVERIPVPNVEYLREDVTYERLVEYGKRIACEEMNEFDKLNEFVSLFYPIKNDLQRA